MHDLIAQRLFFQQIFRVLPFILLLLYVVLTVTEPVEGNDQSEQNKPDYWNMANMVAAATSSF